MMAQQASVGVHYAGGLLSVLTSALGERNEAMVARTVRAPRRASSLLSQLARNAQRHVPERVGAVCGRDSVIAVSDVGRQGDP